MSWYITVAVWLAKAYRRAYERKWSFLGIALLAFFGSVTLLGAYDLLPDAAPVKAAPVVTLAASAIALASTTPEVVVEEPVRIEIPAIQLTASISNPTTTNVDVLDQKLLSGAVRYPTSAKLGETGNVVLFGHSSYLPIVGNQAFKTFNGIQKLVAGDVVTVYSSGTAYTYRVRTMMKESANDAGINLAVTGRVLTLSTCNSFGTKSDRFVVTADFVESHPTST